MWHMGHEVCVRMCVRVHLWQTVWHMGHEVCTHVCAYGSMHVRIYMRALWHISRGQAAGNEDDT